MSKQKILRLILGDQLNKNHSWFAKIDDSVVYVIMEIKSETNNVIHHIQKIIGFFGAMQQFGNELQLAGHQVIYIHINDQENLQSFEKNCLQLINKYKFTKFEYQLPDEFRVDKHLKILVENLEIPYQVYDSEHFYCSRYELSNFFKGKKTILMESFYRQMRAKHSILMENEGKPLFGKWNFDSENRKKLPKKHKPISPLVFSNDLSAIESEIKKASIKTIGSVDSKNFLWPINRNQSLELLDFFIENCLPLFGTYQDAMSENEWSIYHSRLSFSLNTKLISPKEVVNKAIETYHKKSNQIEFHQLEGFVRQIIGWREYMRGIYWAKMPQFATLNYFNNQNGLPKWFWTGNTKMNCLRNSISQSLKFAYAHHIQRLMITGNFALLTGVHPNLVDEWYLGIYIDALDWVEITNTRGMSQFADGGIVGTKPYVSSANYINKMSNYCQNCFYKLDKKVGEKACPFNSLYWNFYHNHESKLVKNPRIGMVYKVWRKMESNMKAEILEQAEIYLKNLDEL